MIIGKAVHQIRITDVLITRAVVQGWECKHKDAPTEVELCQLRNAVCFLASIDDPELIEMISLHWLRNRFVKLRKTGAFK